MIPLRHTLGFRISLRLLLLSLPVLAGAVVFISVYEKSSMEQTVVDKARVAALAGASAYGHILDNGIQAGLIKLDDLTSPALVEIHYPFPVENKRFHSGYDAFTDSHVAEMQDAILASSSEFRYASGMAIGGYVPTTNGFQSEEPTGDPDHDREKSRSKSKYDKAIQLTAAAYVGDEPTLVQDYHRTTGDWIWDVAAPIYVHGQHWGAFRVGVVKSRAQLIAVELARALACVLAVAVLILVLSAMVMVRRSMRPLVRLTQSATLMSTDATGKELSKSVRLSGVDEIVELSKALERCRLSLQASWARM